MFRTTGSNNRDCCSLREEHAQEHAQEQWCATPWNSQEKQLPCSKESQRATWLTLLVDSFSPNPWSRKDHTIFWFIPRCGSHRLWTTAGRKREDQRNARRGGVYDWNTKEFELARVQTGLGGDVRWERPDHSVESRLHTRRNARIWD